MAPMEIDMADEHTELPPRGYFLRLIADGWFWYRTAPGEAWEVIQKREGNFYFNGRDAGQDIESVYDAPKFTLVRVDSPPS